VTLRIALYVGLIACSITATSGAQTGDTRRPVVVVAELDGIVQPVSAEYLIETIDNADASGAGLLIIVLRTPGGLLDSTRDIVARMIAARTPVAVFVAPSGARAASAGFVLAIAADVTAMAPGTHIGAAHPVSGSGEAMDETTSRKAAEDAAAYVRSLAEARGRNVMLAAQAVIDSRAFTDREAVSAMPPLIDLVASDLDSLMTMLDGRSITRFDGRTEVLRTANAEVRRVEMSRRQRFLSAIAHPQIAYLLLTLGILGLTVELWTPGAILPGVAGGLCLLLAFFALQVLPVNVTGVALVIFGMGLLLLELKVPSFGALGVGGTISLVIGAVMITRSVPGIAVGLGSVMAPALALAAVTLLLGRLALAAQRRPPVTGREGLIGERGQTRDPIGPLTHGYVSVHGELWQAVASDPVAAGEPVRVVDVNGLTLRVEPAAAPPSSGEAR
jgi:membrane-bound serine protease (ClpP class)